MTNNVICCFMSIDSNSHSNIPVAFSSRNLGKTAGTGHTKYLAQFMIFNTSFYSVNTNIAHYIKIPSQKH